VAGSPRRDLKTIIPAVCFTEFNDRDFIVGILFG
jgi:hypothetical protein